MNANVNAANKSVPVLIGMNAIELTKDVDVPSQIGSTKDILYSQTACRIPCVRNLGFKVICMPLKHNLNTQNEVVWCEVNECAITHSIPHGALLSRLWVSRSDQWSILCDSSHHVDI